MLSPPIPTIHTGTADYHNENPANFVYEAFGKTDGKMQAHARSNLSKFGGTSQTPQSGALVGRFHIGTKQFSL